MFESIHCGECIHKRRSIYEGCVTCSLDGGRHTSTDSCSAGMMPVGKQKAAEDQMRQLDGKLDAMGQVKLYVIRGEEPGNRYSGAVFVVAAHCDSEAYRLVKTYQRKDWVRSIYARWDLTIVAGNVSPRTISGDIGVIFHIDYSE